MAFQVNEGLWRIGGMYGEVTDSVTGEPLNEVIEISATSEINRIEVPVVGSDRTGYKPGRVARTGSFRTQYIDSRWSLYVHDYLRLTLDERRAQRGRAGGGLKPFTLYIHLNDPDALGYEMWMLEGCQLWALPLGFSITDDIVDREWQFTFEKESPLASFKRTGGITPAGLPAVTQTSVTSQQGA